MTVRCSKYQDCPQLKEFGEITCMHYEEHKPVEFEGGRDCTSAASICPLIAHLDVICLPVEPEVNEDYEAMVADIGINPVAVPA